MKISPLRLATFIGGTLAVFAAGFFFGGVYASTGAARNANAASLIYFTGIHDALERQNYEQAASITNAAVDGHIGVLQMLDAHPWMASTYVLPWMRTQGAWVTSHGVNTVRKSYESQPDKLRPETRAFLMVSH